MAQSVGYCREKPSVGYEKDVKLHLCEIKKD